MKKKFLNSGDWGKKVIFFISLFFIFHNPIESFLCRYIINPFFGNIISNYLTDIGIFILIILYFFFLRWMYKKHFIIPDKYLVFFGLIILIYTYYRFFSNTWSFTEFKWLNKVKYLDVLYLLLFIVLLQILIKKDKRQNNHGPTNNESYKGFIEDIPVKKSEDDSYQRAALAKNLAELILHTKNQNSFAIGIYGKWGSGKTSFVYLIKEAIKEKSKKNSVIEIDFNPWLNSDEKSILIDFYDTLKLHLSKEYLGISRTIDRYKRSLKLSLGTSIFNFMLNNLDGFLQDEHERIKNSIEELDKKIIIYIDDIDRLQAKEIFQVIKLIRNSFNFPNVFFVVSYDREYLINQLEPLIGENLPAYLEKIFQIDIPLPEYEEAILKSKFWQLLKPILKEDDKEKIKEILYNRKKMNIGYDVLSHYREIYRFINSFELSYAKLSGEVNVVDLINLEILRSKFPDVYDFVFIKEGVELCKEPIFSEKIILRNCEDVINNKKNRNGEEAYLEVIRKKLHYNDVQLSLINKLLKLLFPDTNETSKSDKQNNGIETFRRINIPKYFPIYTFYRLTNSLVSYPEFIRAFNGGEDTLKEFIDKHKRSENKLLEIAAILVDMKVDCNDLKTKLLGLKYMHYLNKEKDVHKIIIDEYKHIVESLNKFKSGCSNNDEDYIKNYLKKNDFGYKFSWEFIIDLYTNNIELNQSKSYDFILERNQFEEMIVEIFKEYLREEKPFGEQWNWVYFLIEYKNANKNMTEDNRNKMKKILHNQIKDNIDSFICSLIQKVGKDEDNKDLYNVLYIWEDIFESYSSFKELIRSQKKSKYKDEFLEFLKQKEKVASYVPIHFKFEKLKECIKLKEYIK